MKISTDIYLKVHHFLWLLLFSTSVLTLPLLENGTQSYTDRKVNDIKLRLHNTLEDVRIRRMRSQTQQGSYDVPFVSTRLSNLEETVSAWCIVNVNGVEHVIAATSEGSISAFKNFSLTSLYSFPLHEPMYSLLAFLHGNGLWLVGLHKSNQSGHFIQVYETNYTSIVSKQRISLPGRTLISVANVNDKIYVSSISNIDNDSVLKLFLWTGTQLDVTVSLPLQGRCKSLAMWKMDDALFITASLFDRNLLQILHFNEYYGSLIPVQILEGSFLVVRHFEIYGSHYLVCGQEHAIILYWWSGTYFLKQQEIPIGNTESLVDISVLSASPNLVVIVVAKIDSLEYYIQDSSIFFSKIGSNQLHGMKLKSATLWKNIDSVYLLPVFLEKHPTTVIEIETDTKTLATVQEMSTFQNCSEYLEDILMEINENFANFSAKLDKVWTKDGNNSASSLIVKGDVVSNRSPDITEVVFTSNLDKASPNSALTAYGLLYNRAMNLNFALENTVLKTQYQEIKGSVNFTSPIKLPSVNIYQLGDHTEINSVRTSSLSSALKIHGNQTLHYKTNFRNVIVPLVYTKVLNYKEMKDYLLLKKQQMTKGNLIFIDVFAGDLTIKETLNGVNPFELVTSSASQNVVGLKTFPDVFSSYLSSENYIEVDIKELKKYTSIFTSNYGNELNFTLNVIANNLNLNSINGNSVSQLISNSVKRSRNESIGGTKVFFHPVHAENNLVVSGLVNHVRLEELVNLHFPQTIYGNFECSNVWFNKIQTHLVNGIELCSEVVLKARDSKVNRRVKFLQPLKILNITMNDGVKIDQIDLSSEVNNILLNSDYVFNNTFILSNVHVLNNVDIADVRVADSLKRLTTDVWLKGKSQAVPYGHFKELIANSLQVNRLNGISFEDLVLSNSSSTIDSFKQFEDVETHSISIKGGKTLSGLDFTAEHLTSSESVKNFKVANMFISGDLDISVINSVDLYDLMKIGEMQDCIGIKRFDQINLKSLITNKLDLHEFNHKNIAQYKFNTVQIPPKRDILNKHFYWLKGEQIDTQGLIGGKNFTEFYHSVVTLNTFQSIPPGILFLNALQMKALSVINFTLPPSSNVVLTDRAEDSVLGKIFQGMFVANDVEVTGEVNGIDITALQKSAFYKEIDNKVTAPVRFKAALNTKSIEVLPPARINGISMDELIKVSDTIDTEYMDFSTMYVKDLYIHGKLNGCDLLELESFETNSTIKGAKYLTELKIEGDLYVKGAMNGLSEDDLFVLFYDFLSNTETNGSFSFTSIDATYLYLGNLVNGVDVNFMFQDAVKQDTLKVIRGRKVFKKISSNTTNTNNLDVTFLCGVNVPLLYNKHVSKNAKQTLYIEKLGHTMARNIAIQGTLNKLKLPYDLVLIDTTETISSAIFVNDSITFLSDIHTSGLLDGVELLGFLNDRVLLKSFEDISSTLVFINDLQVQGNLEINEINNVTLNEIVKNTERSTIQDLKTFQETLILNSTLNVLGLINNNSLDDLYGNLYRGGEDENITDVVQFSRLDAPWLIVNTINNISIDSLWDYIHDVEETQFITLDNFTDSISENHKALDIVTDVSSSPLSFYGFFELHQVLNIGPTARFLPFYEAGVFGDPYQLPTIQMMVWLEVNETCRRYKTAVMTVNPDGTLDKIKKVNGRIFPFSLRILEEDVEGFKLHTDRSKTCAMENVRPDVLKAVYVDGEENKHTISSPADSMLLEAKLIEMEKGIYILIAYEFIGEGERLQMYQYNSADETWSLHQSFHSIGISTFDAIFVDDHSKSNEVWLVVTGANGNSGIYLYEWDFELENFGLKTYISKSVSSAALWVSNGRDLFLLLAKEKTNIHKDFSSTPVYTEPVEVHILMDDLKLDHEINIQGIQSLETFKMSGETYVLAVSPHLQTIYIIQYQGINGFQVIQEMNAPGVVGVTLFATTNNDIMLAISSNMGHSRILKCIIRGGKSTFID